MNKHMLETAAQVSDVVNKHFLPILCQSISGIDHHLRGHTMLMLPRILLLRNAHYFTSMTARQI